MAKRNHKSQPRQEQTRIEEATRLDTFIFITVVFLVAALARLVYGMELWRNPVYGWPVIDAASYHNFAATWIQTGLRDSTTAWHAAFYPLFLALTYKLAGVSVFGAMSVQLFIGALTCMGIGWLARRIFGTRAGWFTGLFAALYGPSIFYEAMLMSAGWSVAWSLLMCLDLMQPSPQHPRLRGLRAGLLAGGGVLIRPELLAGYLGALAIKHVVDRRANPSTLAWSWKTGASAALMFCMVVLPIGWMNQTFTGRLSWLPVNGGLNVYIANAGDPCATLGARPGPDYDRIVNLPKMAGLFNLEEQNRYFYRTTLQEIAGDPGAALRRLAWKAGVLLSSREISLDLDGYAVRNYSTWLPWLQAKIGRFGFPFGVVLPLAILSWWHRERRGLATLAAFVLVTALVLLLFSPASRYRLILLPPLLVMAGAGFEQLLAWWKRRDVAWAAVFVVALTGILQSWPGPYCLEKFDFTAERYRMIGQRVEDPAGARAWLEQARLRDATDPQTFFFLAMNSWSQGSLEQALGEINQALALAPDFNMGLMLKSDLLSELDDHERARDALRLAIEANPDMVDAHIRLASSHARDGQYDEARRAIDQALAFAPHHNGARATAAAIMIDAGQPGAALSSLEDLIAQFPDDAELRLHAAIAARALDNETRARHHIIEALRINPTDTRAKKLLQP
jgi:tetratricopeptide (TPR) repeat protein